MELVLPNKFVEIEQEEMMYLDGGSVGSWIATAFDYADGKKDGYIYA